MLEAKIQDHDVMDDPKWINAGLSVYVKSLRRKNTPWNVESRNETNGSRSVQELLFVKVVNALVFRCACDSPLQSDTFFLDFHDRRV